MSAIFRNIMLIMPVLIIGQRIISNEKIGHRIGVWIFGLYMIGVFSVTGCSPMSGFIFGIRGPINLIPFDEIKNMMYIAFIQGHPVVAFRNVIGNILLFMPMGVLLPLCWRECNKWYAVLMGSAIISLLIELWQLFLVRSTDIDDLILNVTGGMCGYCVYIFLKKCGTGGKNVLTSTGKVREIIWCVLTAFIGILIIGFINRAIYL